jgi:glycerol-3-phosphate acyltransferase PlsY
MIAVALVAGYLLGGAPTAEWVARASGVDIRTQGSGNPGANNARRLGGLKVGLLVLLVEVLKGAGCVVLGGLVAGEPGMAAAGIGAVTGNVFSPYRRLSGGQGLGITAGILAAAWPWFLPIALATIALVAGITRSAPKAALAAVAAVGAGTVAWIAFDLPKGWGVSDGPLIALAIGLIVVVGPKQIRNLRSQRVSTDEAATP